MKNKKACKIFQTVWNVLAFFVCVFLGIVYVINYYGVKNAEFYVLACVGLVALYVVHSHVHELGHLILGKLYGGDCLYFSTDFWEVDKTYTESVFRFRYSTYAGRTEIVPKNVQGGYTTIRISALGGILFSIIYVFGLTALGVKLGGVAFPILTVGSLSSFYILLLNVNPFDETSDLHVSLVYSEDLKKLTEVRSSLYVGKTFNDIDDGLFTVSDGGYCADRLKYYYGLKLVYNGDYSGAKGIFGLLTDRDGELSVYALEELFYTRLKLGEKEFTADEQNTVLSYLESEDSPASLRIQAEFWRYKGDTERSRLLYKSSRKLADKCQMKGLKDFESVLSREEN